MNQSVATTPVCAVRRLTRGRVRPLTCIFRNSYFLFRPSGQLLWPLSQLQQFSRSDRQSNLSNQHDSHDFPPWTFRRLDAKRGRSGRFSHRGWLSLKPHFFICQRSPITQGWSCRVFLHRCWDLRFRLVGLRPNDAVHQFASLLVPRRSEIWSPQTASA